MDTIKKIETFIKITFVILGISAVYLNAWISLREHPNPSLVDSIIEVVIDDIEDVIDSQTDFDIDLNDNGK